MKRFGEKAVREAIANGAIIRAWDWYTLEAGYRVIIDDETAGYIVSDLFFKLKNDGTIKKDHWAHSYTDYKAAEEIAAEEATAAALAAVIATEEAATAAEEAEPEYLDEAWPRSNTKPGISYILEWNTPGSSTHHTGCETVEDLESHVQQIKHQGGSIAKAVRWDKNAGTFREFIPETRQEKTDRENWEHCKRIAEELEAYAAGSAYKCPYCGNVHTWDEYEASEHENADEETAYTCPSCEWEINECDLEALSLYDFFADCLDIEYRCGSDREYRSVSIMVACGGPNIYIDTAEKAVLLYWWTDRARYYLSSEAVEAVDDWAREYWECI
jgi:predicted RNA-binding Zn-ribbon protein involved in translation (DUF1610 family)